MLSKSAARKFFLLGTAACSLAFVGLTVDTLKRVPKQTNEAALTESAIRGKHLFDSKNCMGCHTILGEGAYYAPELTKVYERRGPDFIKAMLRNPEAMYPGQRKMVNYHFTEQEISDLTDFLQWIGNMDLNGFPPKPDLAPASVAVNPAQPKVFAQMCAACHSLGGAGGKVGPALDGIGSRRDAAWLSKWLADPLAVKPDSKMAKMPLSEPDIAALAQFLADLKDPAPATATPAAGGAQ
jgi:nitric oxide reductase subunit C